MSAILLERRVNAYNTAHASENKIHDDETARRFGFTGGLVPGVDVFAYMAHPPLQHWGAEWLQRGRLAARFMLPVYDGEDVDVVARGEAPMAVEVRHGERLCASGEASLPGADDGPAIETVPSAVLPEERPPASPESLVRGQVLGTLEVRLDPEEGRAYLRDVREDLPCFEGGQVAHPGWLLRRANRVLAENVKLGPWIHVSSDARFMGLLRAGEALSVRGLVQDNYERNGHLFVDLDVLLLAEGGRPVMRALHTAIYLPRQVREAGAAA